MLYPAMSELLKHVDSRYLLVKDWLGLGKNGRTRAAFSVLSEALGAGDGVVAAFAESYQTLAGETP